MVAAKSKSEALREQVDKDDKLRHKCRSMFSMSPLDRENCLWQTPECICYHPGELLVTDGAEAVSRYGFLPRPGAERAAEVVSRYGVLCSACYKISPRFRDLFEELKQRAPPGPPEHRFTPEPKRKNKGKKRGKK